MSILAAAKSLSRRMPATDRFLKRVFYAAREFAERRIVGTSLQAWIWRRKTLFPGDFATGFRESVDHPHRAFLVRALFRRHPAGTALEIGCNAGPNLYLIAKQVPQVSLHGVDVNAAAIRQGRAAFTRWGLTNVELHTLEDKPLARFADHSIDVVFSDATLMYVGPDRIREVLSHMLRIARRTVLISEWHQPPGSGGSATGAYLFGHWIHDYETMIREMRPDARIMVNYYPSTSWTDANWRRFGALIDADLVTDAAQDAGAHTEQM